MTQQANQADNGTSGQKRLATILADHDMYDRDRLVETESNLYQIANLAKVGAASTDSNLNIKQLADAQSAVFEMIYALASDAADVMERKASKQN